MKLLYFLWHTFKACRFLDMVWDDGRRFHLPLRWYRRNNRTGHCRLCGRRWQVGANGCYRVIFGFRVRDYLGPVSWWLFG